MRKTTAQIYNELMKDRTKYSSLEVAEAQLLTVPKQLEEVIQRAKKELAEDTFAIVMVLKKDFRMAYCVKRMFFYSAFLPKPMPDQAVWVYTHSTGKLQFMWSLPEPEECVYLSWMVQIDPKFKRTAEWCRGYFNKTLLDQRRKETGVTLETEKEYLELNREKLTNALSDYQQGLLSEALN